MTSDRLLWFVMGVIGVGCVILMLNDEVGQSFGVDNDDLANMIWLGTIGTVIGAGILMRGLPAGHVVRQLAMWLIIFLAAMVAYQFAQRFGMNPSNQPAIPESGTGITASLVNSVDRVPHL